MKQDMIRYGMNAAVIFGLILIFAYMTTFVHELGHAAAIWAYGGKVLDMGISSPLSFDDISGYVLTDLPYSVPIVMGGITATTVLALISCIAARRTIFTYFTLCLSACTLYNAAYSLSGFSDFTYLFTHSWWSALFSMGFILLNAYLAHISLEDMFDDLWRYRTIHSLESTLRLLTSIDINWRRRRPALS